MHSALACKRYFVYHDLTGTSRQFARMEQEFITGDSRAMRDVMEVVQKIARLSATVLVLGESGTGKTLVAKTIHDYSRRRNKPFVAVNCAAIAPTLIESELFGYERGAFTGAVARKPGRVELAQGGTLFLDEIGDITPALQVKLLRLLQDRSRAAA